MINELKKYGKVIENVSLKKYTSYHLNEKARYLINVDNKEKLKPLISYLRKNNMKYKIIGGGSNLIFSCDYDGVLIHPIFQKIKIDKNIITVDSGYSLIALSLKAANLSLTGLEFASGIPGTVGGAVVNNSGAYKSDMGYIVKEVTVLTPDLEIKKLKNKDLDYHYRTSFLKKNNGYVVLDATICLQKGNKKEILEIIKDRKKRRMETQPLDYPSAGSVFRNPPGNYAGELIEKTGLKGYVVSGAMVSEKHANFIINKKNATGKDIIKLIEKIKAKVKSEYNIDLILEQEIVE